MSIAPEGEQVDCSALAYSKTACEAAGASGCSYNGLYNDDGSPLGYCPFQREDGSSYEWDALYGVNGMDGMNGMDGLHCSASP